MKHLMVGIAALIVTATVANAADGCGRGMFYNGRRCVPQDGPGYGPPRYERDYGPPSFPTGLRTAVVRAWLRAARRARTSASA